MYIPVVGRECKCFFELLDGVFHLTPSHLGEPPAEPRFEVIRPHRYGVTEMRDGLVFATERGERNAPVVVCLGMTGVEHGSRLEKLEGALDLTLL